jgi:hypothetical protein
MNIESSQPFPNGLNKLVPVNYFLFVKSVTTKIKPSNMVRSELYNADLYMVQPFYKAISNI